MGGPRRIRKRHPAMVQNEVMEPLVRYNERLEPGFHEGSGSSFNQGGGGGGWSRDHNDNFRCDDKFYETQFVLEF